MTALLLLPTAFLLDLLFGDPEVSIHPVRLMGRFAQFVELRLWRPNAGRVLGFLAWFIVVAVTLAVAAAALFSACRVHPLFEFAVGCMLVYVSFAPRDLALHAHRVLRALESGQLPLARRAVSAVVGRDTDDLDEREVSRAAIEAVAESTVDGITAPIFWACLLGPLGAIGYRAINTLDSLWGHKDEKYLNFGMIAARADDAANYLPARLTLLVITLAAWLLRLDARNAIRVGRRDGRLHSSPNSGISEAAFAGALNVTLGGNNRYDGQWHPGPQFGVGASSPCVSTLRQSLKLMWATTLLSILLFTIVRWLLIQLVPI